jgi:ABC-type sugar transport system ATPase subunit
VTEPPVAAPGLGDGAVTGDVVELRGVHKSFGGVHALNGVDLAVAPATVIGLAGENGAGKSTLLKVLSGIYTPDAGEVLYGGVVQRGLVPAAAKAAGIAAVAQELSLFEHLSVAENILVTRPPLRGPFVDTRERERLAREALAQVGSELSPHTIVRDLDFADRQLVEIAKALVGEPRLLILDEPTSGLKEAEVERLLGLIRRLRDAGRSVVFITHRLTEMFAVCDRFVVMKDGESVADRPAKDLTPDEVVRLMVGRRIEAMFPPKRDDAPLPEPTLVVRGLSVPGTPVEGVDFTVSPGEIVGLAGLAGHGQNEILEGVSGIRTARGEVVAGAHRGPFRSPGRARRAGVWLVPEDRKRHGLLLAFSIAKNLTLPTLDRVSRFGFLVPRREAAVVSLAIATMSIRPPSPGLEAHALSGGNQQKVVIGKAVVVDPDVYVFADPTRGIDVGTKAEIYLLLRRLTGEGKAVLLLSTDLAETVGLCDRVLVVSSGRIVAELSGDGLTEESVTEASFAGVAR